MKRGNDDLMRILFLNSARRWGGNEKWTHLAAHALSEKHDVFFAYRDKNIGSRFEIPSFRMPFLSELDAITIGRLIHIIRKEGIEVLVPTKRKDYVLAGIASRIYGIINVIRLGIVRKPRGFQERVVFGRLADGVIVNAESIRETLLESGTLDSDTVRVIYNGLDREALEEAYEKEKSEFPFEFKVCSVGQMVERKRFDVLLDGFARFMKDSEADDAGLILLGDGNELETLKDRAEHLGISQVVCFEGFKENPYPAMAASDVFVSMSGNEGISNAMIEAMVLENAVIATKAGGTEEVIDDGKNGYLMASAEADLLAIHLRRMYENRELVKRMGIAARKTVLTMFDMRKMVEQMVSFFDDLISRE